MWSVYRPRSDSRTSLERSQPRKVDLADIGPHRIAHSGRGRETGEPEPVWVGVRGGGCVGDGRQWCSARPKQRVLQVEAAAVVRGAGVKEDRDWEVELSHL